MAMGPFGAGETEVDTCLYENVFSTASPRNRSRVADPELERMLLAQRREMDPAQPPRDRPRDPALPRRQGVLHLAADVAALHRPPLLREGLQAGGWLLARQPPHARVVRALAGGAGPKPSNAFRAVAFSMAHTSWPPVPPCSSSILGDGVAAGSLPYLATICRSTAAVAHGSAMSRRDRAVQAGSRAPCGAATPQPTFSDCTLSPDIASISRGTSVAPVRAVDRARAWRLRK